MQQSGLYARGMPMGMSTYGMGIPQMSVDQGKGKAREIDFDAAFAQVHASLASSARITEVTDETVDRLANDLQDATLAVEQEHVLEDTEFKQYVLLAFVLFESGSNIRVQSMGADAELRHTASSGGDGEVGGAIQPDDEFAARG